MSSLEWSQETQETAAPDFAHVLDLFRLGVIGIDRLRNEAERYGILTGAEAALDPAPAESTLPRPAEFTCGVCGNVYLALRTGDGSPSPIWHEGGGMASHWTK